MNNLDLDTIKTIVWVILAIVGSTYTYIYRKVAIHRHKQDEIDNAKNDQLAKERAQKQAELDEQKARNDFDNNMSTALEVGKNKVIPLAIDKTLGNQQKRQLAVQNIDAGLKKLGIDLPESVTGEVAERAYQWYKASGGDVHKEQLNQDNNDNQNNNADDIYDASKYSGEHQDAPAKPSDK